jgi:hypothetical protein
MKRKSITKQLEDAIPEAVKNAVKHAMMEYDQELIDEITVDISGIGEVSIEIYAGDAKTSVSLKKLVADYLQAWGDDDDFIDFFPTIADDFEAAASKFRAAFNKKRTPVGTR